jgi:hypothetical protein
MTQLCATITDARVLDRYRIEMTFSDGVRAVVDLAKRIVGRGGVFGPLEDPQYFRQVTVNHELGTIVWPNGADFCPDMLYGWATGEAVSPPASEAVGRREDKSEPDGHLYPASTFAPIELPERPDGR